MRFELTTSTLARLRSTPELHPHHAINQYNNDIFLIGKIIFNFFSFYLVLWILDNYIVLYKDPTKDCILKADRELNSNLSGESAECI